MAVCPNCGEDNPVKAKFCLECGTQLEAAPVPQLEERKVVSVLFVDLVGFTARSHDLDPEDVRAALQPYQRLLKTEVERFGGTVEKFIGDAVMAVFGAPVAHEDDAERAVRAALRITDAIKELNEEANLGLSIRAAVNTGEGLVNLSARPQAGEGMVTGDVVNTASRLQNVASVNGVVVGEITYRSTKDVIVYEAMEPVTVKGKPEPVVIWRAVSARGRVGVDAQGRHSTPFIGRDLDLTLLKTTYQRVVSESSAQLVTVVGEPGVGKSRLLTQFYNYIDDQPDLVTWRQGRSLPYGEGISFWALGEIVKAQTGISESDSPQVAADKVTAAVGTLLDDQADRAWLQIRLAPLVGAASTGEIADKEESFTAWLRFLEAIAAQGPAVLVFEDLHWADAALLEFIEHLVEWSTGVPILIVATARPELFESHPHWAGGARNATTISLSQLTDSEMAQLISALLSQAVLPAKIRAALLDRAGGNPLYAEEFVRMLFDRGVLKQRGRSLMLDLEADVPIPDSIHALIAARLDTLSRERKTLLHNAAVVGKVFWSGAIASLARLDEHTTRRSLQDLVRKELIRPLRSSSIESQQEYSFWHALIRDVAYGQIPRLQRASKHHAVAEWLEGIAGERVPHHAEIIAHHYDEAIVLLRASRDEASIVEITDAAARFHMLAGDRASDLNLTRAMFHYRRALALLPSHDVRRARALLHLGQVTSHLGQREEAMSLLDDARRLFRAHGDKVGEGEAHVLFGATSWWIGRTDDRRQAANEAVTVLARLGPTKELAAAYLQVAAREAMEGHSTAALSWATKAVEVAEKIADTRQLLAALGERGWSRCDIGDLRGLEDLQKAHHESARLGYGAQAADLCSYYTNWLWWIEGPAAALRVYEKSIDVTERRGLLPRAMHARAETLWMLYDVGEWDRLLEIGDGVLLWSEQRKETAVATATIPFLAYVLAWRWHLDEAYDLSSRGLAQTRQIGDLQVLVPTLAVSAFVAGLQRRVPVAVSLIEELDDVTRDSPSWRSRQLPTAVRVLIAVGEAKKAHDLVQGIKVTATRDYNCVLTGEALVAEANHDLEAARNLYQQSALRWGDYGFVLEEGQAHLGLARCLIALGERAAGTEPLHKARSIFARLRAVPLIEEVDRHLGQATALSS